MDELALGGDYSSEQSTGTNQYERTIDAFICKSKYIHNTRAIRI